MLTLIQHLRIPNQIIITCELENGKNEHCFQFILQDLGVKFAVRRVYSAPV
jgi:hypothetical protein